MNSSDTKKSAGRKRDTTVMRVSALERKLVNSIRALEGIDGVGYNFMIYKNLETDSLHLTVNVQVNVEDDDTKKYFSAIHECHDTIMDAGFTNIMLHSCIQYAQIGGEMIIQ